MNPTGIFAKTFVRPTLEGVLDAVAAHGVDCIQFNLASAGLETLPAAIDAATVDRIRAALRERGLKVAALSGTFNIIDPDRLRRAAYLQRLRVLASVASRLECPLITLCSGTRDPNDMWRAHPENTQAEAWAEMRESLKTAISITEAFHVSLGVEPEPGNVVRGARQAWRLLEELRCSRVRIVMDGANIIAGDPAGDHRAMLREAFELLAGDIGLVHAKELPGIAMDWDLYLSLAGKAGYKGPVILHGFAEAEVPRALEQVRGAAARVVERGSRDILLYHKTNLENH